MYFHKTAFPRVHKGFGAGSADLDCEMFLISCPTCVEMTPVNECLIFPLSGDLKALGQNSDLEQWQETELIN